MYYAVFSGSIFYTMEMEIFMENITSYTELLDIINKLEHVMVYTTTPNCSVCHMDYPKIAQIADEYGITVLHVDIAEVPEAAGQMNLFSSPTVILFSEGKEFHRQARIIDFKELVYRIEQLGRKE